MDGKVKRDRDMNLYSNLAIHSVHLSHLFFLVITFYLVCITIWHDTNLLNLYIQGLVVAYYYQLSNCFVKNELYP